MRNADMPAMPNALAMPTNDGFLSTKGLSKREHFAALAFQGLLSSCADKVQSPYSMANDAVACADALLAELEKTNA